MSTLTVLKEYLVGEGGYLLNDNNNGKTVMLSGAWGSGKTHFWLEDIKPQLTEKKQKNIYISLYGRESIHELKFEVLKESYNLEVKDDIISKSASMLSSIAPSLGEKSLVDGFDKLNKKAKEKKAEEILKSGSIICLDDFERKSKNIDLNDIKSNIYNELSRRNDKEGGDKYTSEIKQIILNELKDNEKELSAIWKYGYRLYYMDTVDEKTYNVIVDFVQSGILMKNQGKPLS